MKRYRNTHKRDDIRPLTPEDFVRTLAPVLADDLHTIAGMLFVAEAWAERPADDQQYWMPLEMDDPVHFARQEIEAYLKEIDRGDEPCPPAVRPPPQGPAGSTGPQPRDPTGHAIRRAGAV